jgi:D-3-phosphoglycerate dehydrogenase
MMPSNNVFRILNLEPQGYSASAREILEGLGEVSDGPLSRAELLREVPEMDVLIVRLGHAIDRDVIDAAPRLRAIVSATTGLDHIDLHSARERGISVLSLKGETDFLRTVDATAEHTWALLLALTRRLVPAVLSVRAGEWERDSFRGRELNGARLGILGVGRIGSRVAAYGNAFGMDVSGYDPLIDSWPADVRRTPTLEDLLAVADVLSIHIPLNDETKGLMNRARLALLPAGALLVNTSRGEIVDENALCDALEERRLAGAALDTVCHERDTARRSRSRLMALARKADYLLITPHIGGATKESMANTELFMARKLARFLQHS